MRISHTYKPAASGGLTSYISGGDPLQGAAQGLVVYFANHLAHQGEGGENEKNTENKISNETLNKINTQFAKLSLTTTSLEGGSYTFGAGLKGYRNTLSINKKVGSFKSFSNSLKYSKIAAHLLGSAGKVVGYSSIVIDGLKLNNNSISLSRFTYNTTGTLTSIYLGAETGTFLGGPWGWAIGSLTGATFELGSYLYDKAYELWIIPSSKLINDYENAIQNGWYPK